MARASILVLAAAAMVASAAFAADDNQKPSIAIKGHKFDPTEIHVPAGQRITLTVDNQDPTPEEFESHELKVEKIVPGSSKGIVRFGPLEAGRYPFFGDFNQATAQGVVIAE